MRRQAIYTREDVEGLTKSGTTWNFHDESTQEPLHSLHPYPAKFIPQIPRRAITEWTKRGDVVYDPFVGCGTTLLEASLLGRHSIGTDNNAVAVLVSTAKTSRYTKAELATLRTIAEEIADALPRTRAVAALVPETKNLTYWFSDDVLDRLAALKSLVLKYDPPLRALLLAVFSSIIVRVSYQDSDTRYARIERQLKAADVGKLFDARLRHVIDELPLTMKPKRGKVRVMQTDARSVPGIRSSTVALIVTSPPYLNAYDYHKYHRQRLHWIDADIAFARDIEIGSHDEFTKRNATPDPYFEDMNKCFAEWARVLKTGGRCLVVVGDAIVTKKAVRVGDTYVDLMATHGLALEQRWIRELQATKRSFNVRNSRITHEHVLLFRKKK